MCGILLALLVQPAAASDAKAIGRALESRYRHATTLKAVFFERYSDGGGGVAAESGTVYFSRPGRMRWEYESPERKLFLVDGKNVWFYVPADRTVSRAKVRESSDWRTPLALLAGKADLASVCREVRIAGEKGESADTPEPSAGDTVLLCLPRGSGSVRKIYLEVDSEARLVRVLILEPGNAETEFRFGNWQENIPLSEAMFHFQPPPGVAVVDESALAGEIR